MEIGISLISIGVAFLSVCVAVYSVRESRKAIITGTFFSEMVDAYADYLKCVTCFVYQRGASERDALVPALYRVSLYAPTSISDKAHELFVVVLNWSRSGETRTLAVDEKVNQLRELMRENIADIQKKGHF